MAKEIEKKYLLNYLPKEALELGKLLKIEQGYLSEKPTVRVRITEEDNIKSAYITIKGKKVGISADEFEYSVPLEEGEKMLELSLHTIKKNRYVVPFGELKIELDEFTSVVNGLLVAEIEIPNEAYEIKMPKWLKGAVNKEVSKDNMYSNVNLSKNELKISKKVKTSKKAI